MVGEGGGGGGGGGGCSLSETRPTRSRRRRILDADKQAGLGVLKTEQFSWTSYVYHPLR